jgi:hypothetical protein
VSIRAAGNAAAGGSAGLRGLELLAVRDAAADVLDDLAQRGAHRDLDKAGVVDLAAERERPWCPWTFSVPMEANQSAPLRMICGMLA